MQPCSGRPLWLASLERFRLVTPSRSFDVRCMECLSLVLGRIEKGSLVIEIRMSTRPMEHHEPFAVALRESPAVDVGQENERR